MLLYNHTFSIPHHQNYVHDETHRYYLSEDFWNVIHTKILEFRQHIYENDFYEMKKC